MTLCSWKGAQLIDRILMDTKLITWPNEILEKELDTVGAADETIRLYAREITKHLILNHGLGLSACQIGINKKMFAYWQGDSIKVMVDPIITEYSTETVFKKEGCLSLPLVNVRVGRSQKIKVQYIDLENVIHTEEYTGLEARVIQHEIDHLNGITILDRIPTVLRKILLDKYNKKRLK